MAKINQIWDQNILGIQGVSESGDQFGNSLGVGDFNRDGRDDLAVGVMLEDVGRVKDAGAVNVLFGSRSGIITNKNQIWDQNSRGIGGVSEKGDKFGSSLGVGDFNGDGRDDLAIGSAFEDIGRVKDAGGVNVLYGSRSGLTANNNQFWSQDGSGIAGVSEKEDRFGSSLGVGDFNGDGRDDLAVGVMLEDVGRVKDAGAVNVLYGSRSGLTANKNQIWDQNSEGIAGVSEKEDRFGSSLGVGDFNGDGRDDLAIGSVFEDIGRVKDAGGVNVLYGSRSGLTANNNQFWSQDSRGIAGGSEKGDGFGSSLGVGDFNGDGRDDLAIGSAFEDIGRVKDAGGVNVLYGSRSGLTANNNQFWSQDSRGIAGVSEKGDGFGSSLGVGDFNGDGRDDLVIGSAFEDIGRAKDAGGVNVLYGSRSGLTANNNQFWSQDSLGIQGAANSGDLFGYSLGVGDFNRDGYDDLAIGTIGEDFSGLNNAGAVNILYGSSTGLTSGL